MISHAKFHYRSKYYRFSVTLRFTIKEQLVFILQTSVLKNTIYNVLGDLLLDGQLSNSPEFGKQQFISGELVTEFPQVKVGSFFLFRSLMQLSLPNKFLEI